MRTLILSLGFAAAVSSAAPALACEDAPLRAGWNGTGDLYTGLLLAAETGFAPDVAQAHPAAARPQAHPAAARPQAWKLATMERPSRARAAAESAWGAAWHGAAIAQQAMPQAAGWQQQIVPRKADLADRQGRSADPHDAAAQDGLTLGSAPYALRRWADTELETRVEAEMIAALLDRAAQLYAASIVGARSAYAEGDRAFTVATRRFLEADDAIAAVDPAAHRALEDAFDALAPAYLDWVGAGGRPDVAIVVDVTTRARDTLRQY